MKMRRDLQPEGTPTTQSEFLPAETKLETPSSSLVSKINSAAETHRATAYSTGKHEGHVLIGEGVNINGEIRDCREIEIYGTVTGDLEAEVLIVHENGHVEGNISADRAEVHGSVIGEVSVKSRLDVKAKGSVAGATKYGELSVEAGGRVVGTLDEQTGKFDKSESTSEAKAKIPSTPEPAVERQTEYAGYN